MAGDENVLYEEVRRARMVEVAAEIAGALGVHDERVRVAEVLAHVESLERTGAAVAIGVELGHVHARVPPPAG